MNIEKLTQEIYQHKAMLNVLIEEIIILKGFKSQKEIDDFAIKLKDDISKKIEIIVQNENNQ